jgi:hypothetical protein
VLEHCPYTDMKPESQISRQLRSHRSDETPLGRRRARPATDFHYQATGADFRGTNNRLKHSLSSFRRLSNEFLGAEMKRDYLTEAFCFLIMVGVSAWPIVSMVRALSWLR